MASTVRSTAGPTAAATWAVDASSSNVSTDPRTNSRCAASWTCRAATRRISTIPTRLVTIRSLSTCHRLISTRTRFVKDELRQGRGRRSASWVTGTPRRASPGGSRTASARPAWGRAAGAAGVDGRTRRRRQAVGDHLVEDRELRRWVRRQARDRLAVLGDLERLTRLHPVQVDGQVLTELSNTDAGGPRTRFAHVAHGSTIGVARGPVPSARVQDWEEGVHGDSRRSRPYDRQAIRSARTRRAGWIASIDWLVAACPARRGWPTSSSSSERAPQQLGALVVGAAAVRRTSNRRRWAGESRRSCSWPPRIASRSSPARRSTTSGPRSGPGSPIRSGRATSSP